MKQNGKYFGMTTMQVGILAGLAGLVCILFGLVAWFMLGRVFSLSFAQKPVDTPVPRIISTSTPFAIPTITPTAAPTPIPYEQLIPEGWNQYQTELVELWLPPNFKPESSKSLGDIVNFAVTELIFSGTTSKTSLYRMIVAVFYEPLSGELLNSHLDSKLRTIVPEVRMVERRNVYVNSTEAVRLVFETRSNNLDINELAYIIQDGGTVWYVEYTAQINEYYDMLPTFEESILTFRVVR